MGKKKKKDGYNTSWGLILSIILHGVVVLLLVSFGVRKYSNTVANRAIEISLSDVKFGESSVGSSGKKGYSVREKVEKKGSATRPIPEKKKKKAVQRKTSKKKKTQKVGVKKSKSKKVERKKSEKSPSKVATKKRLAKPSKQISVEKKKDEIVFSKDKKTVKKVSKKKPINTVKKRVEPRSGLERSSDNKSEKEGKEDHKKLLSEREKVLKELKRKNIIENLKKDDLLAKSEGNNSTSSEGEEGQVQGSSSGVSRRSEGKGLGGVNPAVLQVFQQTISSRIKERFKIPPSIPKDGSLKAEIVFTIDREGIVKEVRVKKSSGNRFFDSYCVNAVYSSSPLPSPPADLIPLARSKGFVVEMSNEG